MSPIWPELWTGHFIEMLTKGASFWQCCALMFVAFTGYGRIATLGEEIVEPQRNIPRAIILTLVISGLLYAALICGIIGLLLGLAALIVVITNKRFGKPVQREISFNRPPGEGGVAMSTTTAGETKADKV